MERKRIWAGTLTLWLNLTNHFSTSSSFCSYALLIIIVVISWSLRAEELFQQGLQNLSGTDKSISQVFHLRYAEFHHYHTKQEADAISHYTEVGLRLYVCCMLTLYWIRSATLIHRVRGTKWNDRYNSYYMYKDITFRKADVKHLYDWWLALSLCCTDPCPGLLTQQGLMLTQNTWEWRQCAKVSIRLYRTADAAVQTKGYVLYL